MTNEYMYIKKKLTKYEHATVHNYTLRSISL